MKTISLTLGEKNSTTAAQQQESQQNAQSALQPQG